MTAFSNRYFRLLATAVVLALVGGGLAANTTGLLSIALLGFSLLGGVGLSLVAIALLIEDEPAVAMYAVIFLPFALFLYMVGYGVVLRQAAWGGYASIALGAVVAAFVHGGRLIAAPSSSRPAAVTATARS